MIVLKATKIKDVCQELHFMQYAKEYNFLVLFFGCQSAKYDICAPELFVVNVRILLLSFKLHISNLHFSNA